MLGGISSERPAKEQGNSLDHCFDVCFTDRFEQVITKRRGFVQ